MHTTFKNAWIKGISSLLIILGLLALILQIIRAYQSDHMFVSLWVLLIYFTNQSNILVTIVSILAFLNIEKKWFDKLSFITFANILITGIIFHIFLAQYFDKLSVLQHILHTCVPIIYAVLYLVFLDTKLKVLDSLYAIVYPLIYTLFVYTIVNPLLGPIINIYFPDEPDMVYVYPFLNPHHYSNGFLGVLQLIMLILIPSFIICFMGLLKIKITCIPKIWQEKNA